METRDRIQAMAAVHYEGEFCSCAKLETKVRSTEGPHSANVVVEWLTLIRRIRKVQGSNLGPHGYSDLFFVAFLSPSTQILE
jgi:hypothetical protein